MGPDVSGGLQSYLIVQSPLAYDLTAGSSPALMFVHSNALAVVSIAK